MILRFPLDTSSVAYLNGLFVTLKQPALFVGCVRFGTANKIPLNLYTILMSFHWPIVRNEHNHDIKFGIEQPAESMQRTKGNHNSYSCQSVLLAECMSAKFICHAFDMVGVAISNAYLLFDICSFGMVMQHKCRGVQIIHISCRQ